MNNELKVEDMQAASRLLLAAVGHRCAKAAAIPDLTRAGACSSEEMLAWARLLNLATTPAALRLALTGQGDATAAAAMLRFLCIAGGQPEEDRDKIDLLATWLAARWHASPISDEGQAAVLSGMKSCLPDCDPALPPEARDAIAKFRELGGRARAATSLHELVSSGLYRQARALKQQLGSRFCHPIALAATAAWNLTFAAALERLFLQGVVQMGKVDAGNLLRGAQFFMAAGEQEGSDFIFDLAGDAGAKANGAKPAVKVLDQQGSTPAVGKAEVNNIRDVQITIHNHVITEASEEHRHIVPLADFQLTLSPAEFEAFRASYFEEQSFRGECARAFALLVSVYARLSVVLASYKRKEHSSHLWHHDADCLSHLVPIADKTQESIQTVAEIAESRGLTAKLASLHETCDKLKAAREEAASLLAGRQIPIASDAARLADDVRLTASSLSQAALTAAE